MSGVYIPGIEIPTEKPIAILLCTDRSVGLYDVVARQLQHIRECEPAIPVPDHGRLIDADALGIRDIEKQEYEIYLREKGEDFLDELLLEYLRGRSDAMCHASGLIRFTPTIIPADKEE